jgi:hypothetical protein
MYPSSTLCRTQEEFHRERAASTTLENVRIVSAGAAAAWGHEAVAAEKREARGARTRALAEVIAAEKLEATAVRERAFSENPDRAFEAG